MALQEPSEQLSELWTRVVTIKGEVGSVRSASVGLSTLPLVLPSTMLVGLVAPLRPVLGLAIGLSVALLATGKANSLERSSGVVPATFV